MSEEQPPQTDLEDDLLAVGTILLVITSVGALLYFKLAALPWIGGIFLLWFGGMFLYFFVLGMKESIEENQKRREKAHWEAEE